jgi:hypothetical protein
LDSTSRPSLPPSPPLLAALSPTPQLPCMPPPPGSLEGGG